MFLQVTKDNYYITNLNIISAGEVLTVITLSAISLKLVCCGRSVSRNIIGYVTILRVVCCYNLGNDTCCIHSSNARIGINGGTSVCYGVWVSFCTFMT